MQSEQSIRSHFSAKSAANDTAAVARSSHLGCGKTATEDELSLSELDQGSAEAEQSAADVDQTYADSDQTSSERDQRSADHDQQAADMDQSQIGDSVTDAEATSTYEQTRHMRVATTRARAATGNARHAGASARDQVARQRDELAAARDMASAARDELAATLDTVIARNAVQQAAGGGVADNGADRRPRLRDSRDLAARARVHAAVQRRAAAEDRAQAARDRELSALDRLSYAQELASFELDELTGALRRRVGLAALQREMDRTLRATEQLTVVFIDVDGLKLVNDTEGHAAGDALLRAVVTCISDEFRSYDLIFRLGGDEFVCSLSGDGLSGIDERFKRVAVRLHELIPGATISTGVSERQPEDSVEGMIERADAAMIAARSDAEPRDSP